MNTIYNLRGLNNFLCAVNPKYKHKESELESFIYDTREKLIKEIKSYNSDIHRVARNFNLNVYLAVFDGLCRGYTYEEISQKLGMNRNNVGFTVERLRKFEPLRELYVALKDKEE